MAAKQQYFVYRGARSREISFPLGGIGTGCIGLAGNGRLIDWEIFNRPNKGGINGFSHFAVRAERSGRLLDARVLHGDLPPPYSGSLLGSQFNSFGFGPPREYLSGVPHFREAVFEGRFPVARLVFRDPSFPGSVSLTAFNPFIPLDEADSGLPAAFFLVELENTGRAGLTYTLALTVKNPFGAGSGRNGYTREGELSLMRLGSTGLEPEQPEYGDLTLATDAREVSYQEHWYGGSWYDNLSVFWRDFTTPGPLRNRERPEGGGERLSHSMGDHATLAAHARVAAGARLRLRFLLSWSFPNCLNYWNPEKEGARRRSWRNHYATRFADSTATARYAFTHWERLHSETAAFQECLFGSTLPPEVLDAVSANLSILKSPTCLRLEDGTFYGWEGCHPAAGCCEGSCTHVWNYAYALPFLFPALERSMREADYRYNLAGDGSMSFRLQLPLGRKRWAFRPCADGQLGGVIKSYREWKISGDSGWLRSLWPAIRSSLEYAWSEANPDRWDRDRDGVLEGRQHHTLDMELFGPNSWLTGLYLAALKAAAEMAEQLGEAEKGAEYRELFRRGKAWTDSYLFNGEYYFQRIDLKDRSVLEAFPEGGTLTGGGTVQSYWDEEHGEIKYQIGEGCAVDQVLAQWHANLCGLGEIFDRRQRHSALRAIYRHNFRRGMRDWFNPCRVFCLDDEAGVVICAFPRTQPVLPVPYAQECMNGFEYQAACHLIQEGMVEEGLEIVRAIRGRYDGERRNPWNEFECGSNYARSLASYALLLSLSGFRFDMVRGELGFFPGTEQDRFRCFWCVQGAWGSYERGGRRERLRVLYGNITLSRFCSSRLAMRELRSATLSREGRERIPCRKEGEAVIFERALRLERGAVLEILHR
jgi:non-lysosomal glucosylceramidase